MRKLMLLAGVAALGLSTPLLAKEKGQGGGGRGHGQSAQSAGHGGGHGRGDHGGGQEARGNRGNGGGHEARGNRGHGGGHAERGQGRNGNGQAERRLDRDERRVERAIQQERRIVRQARSEDRRGERRFRDDDRRPAQAARVEDRRDWRGWTERRMVVDNRFDDDSLRFRDERGRRLAIGPAGCPPGLARQNAYCMPPGQLRRAQLIGQRLPIAGLGYNVPERYRYRFADDNRFFYRYGNDGAIYRFDRGSGLVSSVIPIAATGLFLGEPLPLGYDVYNVPIAYRGFYSDNDEYLYRYADNAIYRVDAETRLIEGIVELLTGGSGGLGALGIGDALPGGYDVYNVPFEYRDTYYDTGDSMYRYADGSIYQVDPQTRLIEAVISLLV